MGGEDRLVKLLGELRDLKGPCLLVIDNFNNLQDLEKYYYTLRSFPIFTYCLPPALQNFKMQPVMQSKNCPKKKL
jgi:hypothetical protein